MLKILTVNQAIKEGERLSSDGKRIVLAGGCFDILHVGHIIFLEKAKAAGDALFVFLEADSRIKNIKGENRPFNTQGDRAKILAALVSVDAIIKLPPDLTDQGYDYIVAKIKPDVLAATKGDPNRAHKERQAKMIDARVIEVTDAISDKSTSRLIKLLGKDL